MGSYILSDKDKATTTRATVKDARWLNEARMLEARSGLASLTRELEGRPRAQQSRQSRR